MQVFEKTKMFGFRLLFVSISIGLAVVTGDEIGIDVSHHNGKIDWS